MAKRNEVTSKRMSSLAGWYMAQVSNGNFKDCINSLRGLLGLHPGCGYEAPLKIAIRFLNTGKSLAASCATQAPDKPKRKGK